uniref:ATP synthase subunit s-like protein n=1 Tax=Rhipicephalus pulchellus TaxID=72859 RepID=L7M1V8_RHIPC
MLLQRLPRVLAASAVEANRASTSLLGSTRRCLSDDADWKRKKRQMPVNTSTDYVAIDSKPGPIEAVGSIFKGLGPDFAAALHNIPAYFTERAVFDRKLRREKMRRLSSQKFYPECHGILGPDLAAASFLIFRGALVKFHDKDEWYKKKEDGDTGLPLTHEPGWVVEAIDASNAELYYEGLDNLTCLEGLKALRLAGNPNVDDWFMDRLSQFRETLEHLDVSGCPQITEHGLAALYRLRKLKTITLAHLSHIKHIKLVGLMLEEAIPGCRVLGISYFDSDASPEQNQEDSSSEAHPKPHRQQEEPFSSPEKMEDVSENSQRKSAERST